eukprot:5481298-Ditylum_brightwellii.AAC.1
MSINSKKKARRVGASVQEQFSLSYVLPWYSYQYMENNENFIAIDWVVPQIPNSAFCPRAQAGRKAVIRLKQQ